MIPHLSIKKRIICWLLWHLEGFHKDIELAEMVIVHAPGLSVARSLMRDYWYGYKKPALRGDE